MALLIFMALVLVYIYQSVSASYEYNNDSSLRIDERKSIKNVGIILAGLGSVGQTFLKNIFDRIVDACDHPALHHIQVGVAAIGDSKGYIFHQRGFSWTEIQSILDLKTSNRPISNTVADLETLIKELTQPRSDTDICCFDSYIIVDCTASSSIIEPLIIAKKAGFGVVLANKIPLSDDQHLYNRLVMTNKQRSPLVRYEATVGAGLPVIDALKRVVASGDKILSVQGSHRGTLGYVVSLLNRYVYTHVFVLDMWL
jgi:homoserine dehydrogenase